MPPAELAGDFVNDGKAGNEEGLAFTGPIVWRHSVGVDASLRIGLHHLCPRLVKDFQLALSPRSLGGHNGQSRPLMCAPFCPCLMGRKRPPADVGTECRIGPI